MRISQRLFAIRSRPTEHRAKPLFVCGDKELCLSMSAGATSRNFCFLQSYERQLDRLGGLAERYFFTSPLSFFAARSTTNCSADCGSPSTKTNSSATIASNDREMVGMTGQRPALCKRGRPRKRDEHALADEAGQGEEPLLVN